MTIVLNGTTGITNDGGYTGDGVVFADTTPANTLVTTTGGNVGIGTSSPSAKLDVSTSINLSAQNYLNVAYDLGGGAGWLSGYNITYSSSSVRNVATGTLSGVVYGGSGLQFYTNTSAAAGTAASERMRIDSSGNVGIGTSSPTTRLSVVTASTNAGISVNDGTVNTIIYNSTGGVSSIGTTTNHPVDFYANNAARMRIDSSGNVLIGDTSAAGTGLTLGNGKDLWFKATGYNTWKQVNYQGGLYWNNGIDRVVIDSSGNLLVGTTSTDPIGAKVKGITLNPGNAQVTVMADNNRAMALGRFTGTGNLAEFFYYGGGLAAVGSISTNGSTTSFNTTSDYRLKDNIAPMTGALAKISALKPVTYTWKSTGEADEGFIAHELQEVCPSAVNGVKDAVDAEGNPQYQGIDTSFLVATLTAAIQELKAINDAQAETITALTARVTALEGA